MTDWVIWYHDGNSFSSDDGPPQQAWRDGVQVVAVADRIYGRLLWHGFDAYCWQDGTWVPHSQTGIEQYHRFWDNGVVLNGFAISDEAFRAIFMRAIEDQRLSAKTDISPDEHPLPNRYKLYFTFAETE